MTTNFKFDHINKTIVCSKAALKKAGNPTTKEYKELMSMIKKQPTFTVVEREIKKNETKKTYEGLTKKFMISYIENQKESEKYMDELNKALKDGGYPLAKSWFIQTFEGFSMSKARKDINKEKVLRIQGRSGKVVQLSKASGQ